jgi:hypothetical protein
MKRFVRSAVAAAFVAGLMASSVAHAVVEMEGNDSVGTAQPLTVTGGSVEVTGSIGATTTSVAATADVDYYSFEATEGNVVTIDIGGGIKDGGPMSPIRSVDTVIAVFTADGTKLRENDDADDIDAGSIATNDSRIVDFVVPANGKYVVGVSSFPRTFGDQGGTTSTDVSGRTSNGSYTLTISGVTTPPPPVVELPPEETPPPPGPVQKVRIDIRPRDPGVARVYPQADGRISVAILSSRSFNALKVDHYSMTFGAEGNEASYLGCHKEGIDVNRDGRKDLVCRFDNKKAGFDVGDLEGVLKGTVEGRAFEGRAPLRVVMKGKKRKHHHDHDRYDHRGHGDRYSSRGRDD